MAAATRSILAVVLAGASTVAPAQGGDVAALRAQVDALQQQVRALSEQIDRLDSGSSPAAVDAQLPAAAAAIPRAPVEPAASAARLVPPTLPIEAAALEDGKRLNAIPPAPLESAIVAQSGRSAAFQLSAGSGDGKVSLRLARARSYPGPKIERAQGVFDAVLVDESISLTASSPLGEGESVGFATLNKLANGQALNLRAIWFRGPVPLPDTIPRLVAIKNQAIATCQREAREALSAGAERDRVIQSCARIQDADFWKNNLTQVENIERENVYAGASLRRSVAYGVNLGVARKEFSYFDLGQFEADDPLAFQKRSSAKIALSAGGFLGFFPAPATALTLGADYQRAYSAAKSRINCPVPPTGAATVRCTQGAFAGPDKDEALLLSGELRFAPRAGNLATGFLGKWAVAPRVEYDALSNDVAFDLPIYLVPDDDGNLVGGVRLGYTTAEKTVLGVFVGTSFNLYSD